MRVTCTQIHNKLIQKVLIADVSCYDALSQETFMLRGHILSSSGDILALSKIMCISDHNAYSGCCFCYFHETYSETAHHVYFSLSPPKGYSGEIYNSNKLPMCINGHSILFELHSISFPASFPKLNNAEYKITTNHWNEIGKIVELNWKMMSSEFGRPPINIQKYCNSLKTEDWYNWTAKFVRAVQLCLEPIISKEKLREIKEEYYQREPECLQAMLISFHYLLHIAESIFETGPLWATWQFPME
ncbi:17192_t:CDS:2 [Cetraspora pellucida]|uniref:17192_t:CDS:1 n=1 Tax=Cetraspora pellucida TaxID=1433469 RepID=A0ACA9L5I5_9GLOM|nr:17192_t:CDS:2 [Cetraspora pellucida]